MNQSRKTRQPDHFMLYMTLTLLLWVVVFVVVLVTQTVTPPRRDSQPAEAPFDPPSSPFTSSPFTSGRFASPADTPFMPRPRRQTPAPLPPARAYERVVFGDAFLIDATTDLFDADITEVSDTDTSGTDTSDINTGDADISDIDTGDVGANGDANGDVNANGDTDSTDVSDADTVDMVDTDIPETDVTDVDVTSTHVADTDVANTDAAASTATHSPSATAITPPPLLPVDTPPDPDNPTATTRTITVIFNSQPSGAEVIISERVLGITPLELILPASQDVFFTLAMPSSSSGTSGFRRFSSVLNSTEDTVIDVQLEPISPLPSAALPTAAIEGFGTTNALRDSPANAQAVRDTVARLLEEARADYRAALSDRLVQRLQAEIDALEAELSRLDALLVTLEPADERDTDDAAPHDTDSNDADSTN